MTPNIPLEELKGGLRSKILSFWIGLHNLLTSIPLILFEHTWNHLKMCLSGYENAPTEVYQLWERVVVEWENISVKQCQKWTESMPKRIKTVIKAKGAHTKY